MKKSLFEIASEYKIAIEELENHCIENGTDEIPEGINERLVINQDELQEKIKSYFYVITELEGNIETLSNHVKSINAKKKAIQNNIDRLKKYVGQAVELYGDENKTGNHFVATELFKVTASRSNKLRVLDQSMLPDELKSEETKVIVKVDTKALKSRLNGGEIIEGAEIDDSTINVTFR